MQPLDRVLRNQLENTVREARDIAENASRAALEHLCVGDALAPTHLNEQERDLRRKLRIHGRQLGDERRSGTNSQEISRLIEEVAYEHWHRMLFARFLAENGLLMYWQEGESTPIDVDIATCQELLDEGVEQAGSVWELAARFASRMLPQIFRQDSPLLELIFPPEHQHGLERLIADLPLKMFNSSDSLGWVYQFWQAKKKKEVNDSGIKIGARELPAVTQLFTEPYMVSFLLDNSLGAWWAGKRLGLPTKSIVGTETELRQKASIPGVPLDFLRFVQVGDGAWTPAAGTFEKWPKTLSALKMLDPCCGSGHFLVAAFLMLVPMRMELEELSPRGAVDVVLRDNIHGLELDQRCVEIAAFALALAAWRYPGAGGYRPLPEIHLACSGLSPSIAKDEWKQLGLGKRNLTIALDWMYEVFKDAPVLGSLLNPAKTVDTQLIQWDELASVLDQALQQEKHEEQHEVAVVAQGLAKAATLLAGKYQWVITNVPYLARGKQHDKLRDFCERNYPAAKNDLATVFLDRCLEFCVLGGTASIVLPQNWLFLTSYKKFREKLLLNDTWHFTARLGEGGFESSAAAGAFVSMITLSRGNDSANTDALIGKNSSIQLIRGLDVSEPRTAQEKANHLVLNTVKSVEQLKQMKNPDARISLVDSEGETLLEQYGLAYQGISPADLPKFGRLFWEQPKTADWEYWQGSVDDSIHYGGCEQVINLIGVRVKASIEKSACVRGEYTWEKDGVVISAMRALPVAISQGKPYDTNIAVYVPYESSHLPAIWCFCSSPAYYEAVRQIDQSLKVTNATLAKVPFDIDLWTEVVENQYPNGLPLPYSNDPTQWLFHGHPCGSVVWDEEKKWTVDGPLRMDETVLQVAITRLLGYHWPAELDDNMELAVEQREWVNRCSALLPYADEDGIVCIPPVRGEMAASERLLNLLASAYGEAWSNDTFSRLLQHADYAGKALDTWLHEKFFTQHCKLFQHRPFIWHIWDGLRDGFSALVNYHMLDAKKLETLIYTYLGDWISRQKQDEANKVDGAQERLAAAETLKKRLELILEGEAPYDIFVRWKPLHEQPVGWSPDLNDGVRINIRPFLSVPDVGKKGAGVLRDAPNINWNKDRGKDENSAPWYHEFHGDRINDYHISLVDKQKAREQVVVP